MPPQFPLAPAPWACKCTTYWLLTYLSTLPANAYAPLEDSFAPTHEGDFKGGPVMIQVVSYSETPVGSYNELIIIPGYFEVPGRLDGDGVDGKKSKRKKLRITRIYVDQKDTTFNGRKNWNIPKHLARFTFATLSNPPRTKIQVFPPDPSVTTPFFSTTIQPFRWTPSFSFSTTISPYLGLDVELLQPPLPASENVHQGEEEICGTEDGKWRMSLPLVTCKEVRLCWVEVDTQEDEEMEKWWPKVKPWKVGLALKDAQLDFPESTVLE